MNAMQQAMIQAGLASHEKVEQTNKTDAIYKELTKTKQMAVRRGQLTKKLGALQKFAEQNPHAVDYVREQLEVLADAYSDIFAEVATQQAWKIHLSSYLKQ